MPKILEPIDRIARVLKRDVLFLQFENYSHRTNPPLQARIQALMWLMENGFHFEECYDYEIDGMIVYPYLGSIYIDIPYDVDNPQYLKIQNHFEKPDGSMKQPGVTLCLLQLSVALKNAHHDEPGYWDDL